MIELELSRGRNAMGIWQDLVDKHGFTSSYQSVQRFVLKLRGAVSAEARVIIETKLGEEAQVDYGTGPMVRDPDSGKYRRTRLFVLTLGCSRKSVRLLVFRSSARVWAELHERAFRRLGGSPRIVVLDNLREGVLSPDFYDPGLNPLYRYVLAHYGVTALPCKVRDPDRKGKVESGGWPAVARVFRCGQRLCSRRPDGGGALNAQHVTQFHFGYGLTKARIVAVCRVGQHGSLGNSVGNGLADLAECNLQLGLKNNVVGNLGLAPELAVIGPDFRQIQTVGDGQTGVPRGHRQEGDYKRLR
jgi:hypothetical protein